MIIGERIRARRLELKMSQRELSDRIGYSEHSTVTRIENGKVDLSQSRIVQFADALGVTPAYLMGWDTEPEDLGALAAQVLKSPKLLQLVQNYLLLDESDQYTLDLLAESLASRKKD